MAFQPRLLADGTPCCASRTPDGRLAFPRHACPKCREHAASRRLASADYSPPEPYAKGIDALRRDLPTRAYPAPQPTSATPTTYAPPDAYAKLKESR